MALLFEALQARNNEHGFNLVVYNPQFTVRTQQLCKARNVFIKWRKWKRRLMSHRTYLRCCLHSCPKPLLASQSISAHQGNLYIVPTIALRPIIGMPWHTKIFTRKADRSWMQAQASVCPLFKVWSPAPQYIRSNYIRFYTNNSGRGS